MIQLGEPFFCEFTIGIVCEVGTPEGEMDKVGGRVGGVFADKMVPGQGKGTDFSSPFEAMEFEAGSGVDVIGGERLNGGAVAIEDHQGRPVFAGVGGLGLVEEFGGGGGGVVVLDTVDVGGGEGINEIDEAEDVGAAEEVAVEEDTGTASAGKVGCQEAGIGEFGRGERVAGAFVAVGKLRADKG